MQNRNLGAADLSDGVGLSTFRDGKWWTLYKKYYKWGPPTDDRTLVPIVRKYPSRGYFSCVGPQHLETILSCIVGGLLHTRCILPVIGMSGRIEAYYTCGLVRFLQYIIQLDCDMHFFWFLMRFLQVGSSDFKEDICFFLACVSPSSSSVHDDLLRCIVQF